MTRHEYCRHIPLSREQHQKLLGVCLRNMLQIYCTDYSGSHISSQNAVSEEVFIVDLIGF